MNIVCMCICMSTHVCMHASVCAGVITCVSAWIHPRTFNTDNSHKKKETARSLCSHKGLTLPAQLSFLHTLCWVCPSPNLILLGCRSPLSGGHSIRNAPIFTTSQSEFFTPTISDSACQPVPCKARIAISTMSCWLPSNPLCLHSLYSIIVPLSSGYAAIRDKRAH